MVVSLVLWRRGFFVVCVEVSDCAVVVESSDGCEGEWGCFLSQDRYVFGRGGDEELEVFAAGESEGESLFVGKGFQKRLSDGDGGDIQVCSELCCGTEFCEVGSQSVGDIHDGVNVGGDEQGFFPSRGGVVVSLCGFLLFGCLLFGWNFL